MKIIAVKLKHGKHIHIVENQYKTICGKTIGEKSFNYHRVPRKETICKNCLAYIGSYMFDEYIGFDNLE